MAKLLARSFLNRLFQRLRCDATENCRCSCPSLQHKSWFSTHYETLGIKKDAKASDIKKAYIEKTKAYHPDVINSDDAEEFLKISEAYEVLKDANSRREYDFKKFGMSSDYNRFETGEYSIPRHDTPERRKRYEQKVKESGEKHAKTKPVIDETIKMALSGREKVLLEYLIGALVSICVAMYLISRYQREHAIGLHNPNNSKDDD